MKFALISNILPPSESGHAMIIYRLLRDLDPDDYCLLSSKNYETAASPNYSGKLPGKYYHLAQPFQLTRGSRFGLQALRERVNLTMGIILRGREIARIVRRERCGAVVVCTGGHDVLDMPAGYLASRLTRARFYAYLLDQYIQMVSYVLGERFVKHLEPLMMRGADAVIAPNEFLRDELRRRYQIEAEVIHNPCDLSEYERGRSEGGLDGGHGKSGDEVRIVYTGGVGTLHFDAFRNLVAAIQLLKRGKVTLHLYTAQPPEILSEYEGIRGPVVYHDHESVSAMPDVQKRADVLFLPLAFASPHPEIIRTAAPGKMGEYLAARRPILVHAPPDSFIAWYFRRHECGLVVDQNDPEQLARAIELLLTDAGLRDKLSTRAWERAQADFSLLNARAKFRELIELKARS